MLLYFDVIGVVVVIIGVVVAIVGRFIIVVFVVGVIFWSVFIVRFYVRRDRVVVWYCF